MNKIRKLTIEGKNKEAKQLIDTIDVKKNDVSNLLIDAITSGNYSIVKFFISRGIDLNNVTNHDLYPVYMAIKCGQTAILGLLLENGACIRAKNDNRKFIFSIDLCYEIDKAKTMIKLLIEHGENINTGTGNFAYPYNLIDTCLIGGYNLDIIEYLLSMGAVSNYAKLKPGYIRAVNWGLSFEKKLVWLMFIRVIWLAHYFDPNSTFYKDRCCYDTLKIIIDYVMSPFNYVKCRR